MKVAIYKVALFMLAFRVYKVQVLFYQHLVLTIVTYNQLLEDMYKFLSLKLLKSLPRFSRTFFAKKDPLKQFQQLLKQAKKKMNDIKPDNQSPNLYNEKVLIGIAIYLATCVGLYQLKKDRALLISQEEVINAIRKSEVSVIYVVKETSKNQTDEQEKPKDSSQKNHSSKETNFRKIYLKIDGVDHICFVPEIGVFRDKITMIQKNKSSEKVRIIEQEEITIDSKIRRFFKAILKVVMPLVFPILLFNSSIGKLFKTNVLGQTEGFRPNIKFKDIAGMGNAKIQISQLVDFLKNPAKYKKIGAKVPKGALLSGPPGTGKTMLAKACAGQADVPFFSVSGSQFVQLYAGMGATRVRDLFKNAKKQTPSIIFIDQIDAIGRKRQDKFGGANDQRANTLNQLLVEMDGFGTSEDIIILAATNRKEMLDSALTRPGRFDRMVQIDLPDIQGRQEILQIYLKKIKLSPVQTFTDYSRRLATLTYGFSGADLANLCNQAAILAVRKSRQFVLPKDFQSASERVLAGLQQNLNLSAQEKKKIAYHEAGHAVVAWFSEGAPPLLKITIIPRSKGSLGFAQYLPDESSLMNKKQLYDQMCVILGGRMSEEVFFKEVSNGASDDLSKLRGMARAMILRYGMSELFPNYAPIETEGQNVFSEQTATKIDKEVMRVIEECTTLTRKTVNLYRDKITALAQAVLKKESLNHNEIKQILGDRPFEIKQNYREFLQNAEKPKKADLLV